MPRWALIVPLLAIALLGAAMVWPGGTPLLVLSGLALIGAVQAAVHHAEVVAHRVGEPFGTLVLAVAVTVIEVALIVSMMLAGGPTRPTLPRDTIFAAVMIICNGVVGLCLLVGGLRHHEQSFRIEGANTGLAALVALATLSLVLPTFTTSSPGGDLHDRRNSRSLRWRRWCCGRVFVFVQTVRHRDYFLPAGDGVERGGPRRAAAQRTALASFGLLLVALVAVVGLAKVLSPTIEARVAAARARRRRCIGIAIALLVLLPETVGRGARGAREPAADQPQPRLRLGAGEHRPDDPGGRRGRRCGWACRWCSASSRRTWCCWR